MEARNVQCWLLFGVRLFQQFMRNVLAPLIVFMPESLHASRGQLLSAVAAGYFFTQLPGGALADRIGARSVITMALLGSVAACLAIPFAFDAYGADGIYWCLVFMGAIQGPLFPTSSVFLSKWIPPNERSQASTIMDTGISVGALICVPIGIRLAEGMGWQGAYTTVGLISLTFTVFWMMFSAETPQTCSYITQEEKSFLSANVVQKKPKAADKEGKGSSSSFIPMNCLFHPSVVAIFLSHIAFNYGAYFVTNWNPTYYKEVLGVTDAGLHLSIPHALNLSGKMLNNTIASFLAKMGVSRLGARRFFTIASALGSAACMLPIYYCKDLPLFVTTVLISAANGFFGLAPSGFKANYLDVTVEYTGVISGVGNTLGTVASYCGPLLVQYILKTTGSWFFIFLSIVCLNAVTALTYFLFSSDSPVEQRTKKQT